MSRRRRNETEEQRARRELISDFLSAANIQSMDDIQELFKEALAGFIEGSLESELDSELGYEPYDIKNKETDNSRNGHSKKTLRTSMGKVDIEVPRDRNGEFEPKILPKNQTSISLRIWRTRSSPCMQKVCQHPILRIIFAIFMVWRYQILPSVVSLIKCSLLQRNGSRDRLKASMQLSFSTLSIIMSAARDRSSRRLYT